MILLGIWCVKRTLLVVKLFNAFDAGLKTQHRFIKANRRQHETPRARFIG